MIWIGKLSWAISLLVCPSFLKVYYYYVRVLWLPSLPFQSSSLSLSDEEENVSFVMRCLVLLWCVFSQTWRNLVIHQVFFSFSSLSLLFNFCLDETVVHISFFFLLSRFSFISPAFEAPKTLLRAIDKMLHITFCTVHYFTDMYKRDKHFSKIKKDRWMLCGSM